MAFLPGWKQFVDITIPDTLIDEDLTQPAILVKISASCGIGSKDASFIFSELGDNSLKIAFTEAGLTDEKYAEVESWSSGDVEAYVWVSKSDLVLDADGNPAYVLRMYFDNDHADNTDYIGVPGSAQGEAIWDSHHKMVLHFAEDPGPGGAGDILDSTSNDNDGTATASMETGDLVAGIIGNALNFDGSNDFITVSDDETLDLLSGFTLEAWVYADDNTASVVRCIAEKSDLTSGGGGWAIAQTGTALGANKVWVFLPDGSAPSPLFQTDDAIPLGSWFHLVVTWDGTTSSGGIKAYYNLVAKSGTESDYGTTNIANDLDFLIAGKVGTGSFSGKLDEVRISDPRSVAWIKANYNFQIDNVLSLGDRIQVPLLRHGFVNFQEPGVF